MSIEHLSDKRIQEYLDNKSKSREFTAGEQNHLRSCEICRGTLADYGRLYSGLAREEKLLLSSDFTSRTLARIRALEQPGMAMSRSMLLAIVSCVLIACSAIYYFVNVKAVLQSIESFSVSRLIPGSAILNSVEQLSTKLGGNLDILIFAGLVLILVGLVDKLLVKQKANRAYFLSV